MEFFHLWYQKFLIGHSIVNAGLDLIPEFTNRKLASTFPYGIGLVPGSDGAYPIMMNASIHTISGCADIPFSDYRPLEAS